jgi:hypothetical protein
MQTKLTILNQESYKIQFKIEREDQDVFYLDFYHYSRWFNLGKTLKTNLCPKFPVGTISLTDKIKYIINSYQKLVQTISENRVNHD